ncbi:hypothetical protein JHK82_042808 [Glycine max]|nr:hypothetical protein JHK85_043468 [Glycine max]KAG5105838.1 hypothetical protein JHK82_042808 [Glycine max]
MVGNLDVLAIVHAIVNDDVSQRKHFIRGLGRDTTIDGLRLLFSTFGNLEEAFVILEDALLALHEPSKRIDVWVTVMQLVATGNSVSNAILTYVALHKNYIDNVPSDLPADKLLVHFFVYGEIKEGLLGFDKQTGKLKGCSCFPYDKILSHHALSSSEFGSNSSIMHHLFSIA